MGGSAHNDFLLTLQKGKKYEKKECVKFQKYSGSPLKRCEESASTDCPQDLKWRGRGQGKGLRHRGLGLAGGKFRRKRSHRKERIICSLVNEEKNPAQKVLNKGGMEGEGLQEASGKKEHCSQKTLGGKIQKRGLKNASVAYKRPENEGGK